MGGFTLIAKTVILLSVAGIVVLDMSLFAGTFGMPYSAYFLIFCAKVAFDFTEFV